MTSSGYLHDLASSRKSLAASSCRDCTLQSPKWRCTELPQASKALQVHAWLRCAGAKVALCELPRDFISSEDRGGTGGTCVLRGCVPKKLMAIAGLFNEEMQDAVGYGCAPCCPVCSSRCSAAKSALRKQHTARSTLNLNVCGLKRRRVA